MGSLKDADCAWARATSETDFAEAAEVKIRSIRSNLSLYMWSRKSSHSTNPDPVCFFNNKMQHYHGNFAFICVLSSFVFIFVSVICLHLFLCLSRFVVLLLLFNRFLVLTCFVFKFLISNPDIILTYFSSRLNQVISIQ